MAALSDQLTDRFIAKLNSLDHTPTWNEASGMGAELFDFDLERRVLESRIADVRSDYHEHQEQLERQGDIHAAEEYIKYLEHQRDEFVEQPGRYHLSSGEVIQVDPATGQAARSGWWFTNEATVVTTPTGERFHQPGIHPDAKIDPRAHVDPTARVEANAVIGPHARIGAHTHVGRGAMIDAQCVVQEGAWIGPGCELWSRAWVSPGATIGAHSVIGTRTTVGAGARVAQHSQIEPFSRLGARTNTSTNGAKSHRSGQVAGLIDRLMRLDHD